MIFKIESLKDHNISEICNFFNTEKEMYYAFPKEEYPLTKKKFYKTIEDRSDNTIIKCNEVLAGFGNLYEINQNKACNIGNVIINPDLRSKGIGRALIKELINIAVKKYKIKKIGLYCWCENSKGLLFYNSIGFTPKKIIEFNKKGERIPVLQMEYIIP